MTIYGQIDTARKAHGITWSYLENKINGYRGKFVDLKKGKTTLTSEEIAVLAQTLSVSTDYLLGKTDDPQPRESPSSAPVLTDAKEINLITKYRRLRPEWKEAVNSVLDIGSRDNEEAETPQKQPETPPEPPKKARKVIPLYYTPAAAGYASPALGEDYEDYEVPASSKADFAARIQGDSMEPWIADGSIVLVKREGVHIGDVGLFFVDGDMKCKQYCKDNYGNVYLFSLNRKRADADVTIRASSGITLCCFGKVLLKRRPPLPLA